MSLLWKYRRVAVMILALISIGLMYTGSKQDPDAADDLKQRLQKIEIPTFVKHPDNFHVSPTEVEDEWTRALRETSRVRLHISTDKPIYKLGDMFYARAYALNVFDHRPTSLNSSVPMCNFQIKGPSGVVVHSGLASSSSWPFVMNWRVPGDIVGGQYTLVVDGQSCLEASRTFQVLEFTNPRLKLDLQFDRKGYGGGDVFTAFLSCERAEGGVCSSTAEVSFVARAGLHNVASGHAKFDDSGKAVLTSKLADTLLSSDGVLSVTVADGGFLESTAKTLPLLLKRLSMHFYPAGGDLVAGLENTVFVESFAPSTDPADFIADLVEVESVKNGFLAASDVLIVSGIKTEHEGRTSFPFRPMLGKNYALRVTQPSSVTELNHLPTPQPHGAVMDHQLNDRNLKVTIASTDAGLYNLTLYRLEKVVQSSVRNVDAAIPTTFDFDLSAMLFDGVHRLTLYAVNGTATKAVAERLVFVTPRNRIKVDVSLDRIVYAPGGGVQLKIKTTDSAAGKPVAATVAVTVSDDSVLSTVDKRKRPPRLPSMAYLEYEVEHLYDPDNYLDKMFISSNTSQKAEAERNIFLLLGTQGWRRFVYDRRKPLDLISEKKSLWGPLFAVDTHEFEMRQMPVFMKHNFIARGKVLHAPMAMMMVMDDAAGGAPPVNELAMAPPPVGAAVAVAAAGRRVGGANMADITAPPMGKRRADFAEARERVMPLPMFAPGQHDIDIRHDNFMREYAHTLRAGWNPNNRQDFTETVYWSAGVATDATGLVTASFSLSDSVTSFHVIAEAVSADGLLGLGVGSVISKKPFFIEPRLPVELSLRDSVLLPVIVSNNVESEIKSTLLADPVGSWATVSAAMRTSSVTVGAGMSVRTYVGFEAAAVANQAAVIFRASASDASTRQYDDQVRKSTRVVPFGFPIEIHKSGLLTETEVQNFTFAFSKTMVPGSANLSVNVYPSPLASLTQALEALIREPFGCFEQTSSTSYPLVMAAQYFKTHHGVNSELIQKSQQMLEKSYKKLISFESKTGGFEWFGESPGHEALTAYGLLQFTDMNQVYAVDPHLLARVNSWLIGRRDGSGGFLRNPKSLDTFGAASPNITNAYIIWSLTFAGHQELSEEVEALRTLAVDSSDTYFTGLVAGSLYNVQRTAEGQALASKLVKKQQKDGSVSESVRSVTGSEGDSLVIETTSIAILTWINDHKLFAENIELAINWLATRCKDGRFGSTQATVLALKAIIQYDLHRPAISGRGAVVLSVQGNKVASMPVSSDTKTVVNFMDALKDFPWINSVESYKVELSMEWEHNVTGSLQIPYSFALSYYDPQPAPQKACAVSLVLKMSERELVEGDGVSVSVEVTNTQDKEQSMVVAIVGLPGGLEPRLEKLQELVAAQTVSYFEIHGREVIFYWRGMDKNQHILLSFDAIAKVPGTFQGPASRAYLYYTDELKSWHEALSVSIKPKPSVSSLIG